MPILMLILKITLIWFLANIAAALIAKTAQLSWKTIKPMKRIVRIPKLKPAN